MPSCFFYAQILLRRSFPEDHLPKMSWIQVRFNIWCGVFASVSRGSGCCINVQMSFQASVAAGIGSQDVRYWYSLKHESVPFEAEINTVGMWFGISGFLSLGLGHERQSNVETLAPNYKYQRRIIEDWGIMKVRAQNKSKIKNHWTSPSCVTSSRPQGLASNLPTVFDAARKSTSTFNTLEYKTLHRSQSQVQGQASQEWPAKRLCSVARNHPRQERPQIGAPYIRLGKDPSEPLTAGFLSSSPSASGWTNSTGFFFLDLLWWRLRAVTAAFRLVHREVVLFKARGFKPSTIQFDYLPRQQENCTLTPPPAQLVMIRNPMVGRGLKRFLHPLFGWGIRRRW